MTLAVLCSGPGPQQSNIFALTGDSPEAATAVRERRHLPARSSGIHSITR